MSEAIVTEYNCAHVRSGVNAVSFFAPQVSPASSATSMSSIRAHVLHSYNLTAHYATECAVREIRKHSWKFKVVYQSCYSEQTDALHITCPATYT